MAPNATEIIPIADIRDNLVVLKNNSLRGIVQVSAVNFELRSSDEQHAMLQQFQGFLDSLDFPAQIVVQSRKFSVISYLDAVSVALKDVKNDLLKLQGAEYLRFVEELSDLSNVMVKKFFVVIPISAPAIDQNTGKGFLGGFSRFWKKKSKQAQEKPTEPVIDTTLKEQLDLRSDLIIGGLSGIGLNGHLVAHDELIALFADTMNPVAPAHKTNGQS